MINALLVAHIAVLGYWLGSELVINATFRYVSYGASMPYAERERLMDHVMVVDQHVRYALVLQATLGTMLSAAYGFLPGAQKLLWGAALVGAAWLLFVELVHRWRGQPVGVRLAALDRLSRYVLIVLLLALGTGLLGADWALPVWLRWKLGCFAGVVGCGVAIRLALLGWFRCWGELRADPASETLNSALVRHYWRATAVLIVLWLFIAAIVALSILKPVAGQ
ncbi:MAG TPA: hypothetical protein DD491_10040 [Halieaceae bacterium]|nr:hypothetical protein [Halieaceae bacterium]